MARRIYGASFDEPREGDRARLLRLHCQPFFPGRLSCTVSLSSREDSPASALAPFGAALARIVAQAENAQPLAERVAVDPEEAGRFELIASR